jgi:hypothetical protein
MKRKQKPNTRVSNPVRWLVVWSVLFSLLSLQQAWAESTICLCDHPEYHARRSDHCAGHQAGAGQHEIESSPAVMLHMACGDMDGESSDQVESQAAQHLTTEWALEPLESRSADSSDAALSCCHILPAANTPPATTSVQITPAADHSPSSLELFRPAQYASAAVFHPPPGRPIYLTVSSLLI